MYLLHYTFFPFYLLKINCKIIPGKSSGTSRERHYHLGGDSSCVSHPWQPSVGQDVEMEDSEFDAPDPNEFES
jgi:hypothetical protein